MTTAELDALLLDNLSESSSNSSFEESTRYAFLNRAYREIVRRTWATIRQASTFSITDGDQTWTLTDEMTLTAGHKIRDIVRVQYLVSGVVQHDLVRLDYEQILALRSYLADDGTYPRYFAYFQVDTSGVKAPTLAVYPPVKDTGSDILYLDWIELGATLSSSVNPITPSYCDDAHAMLATVYALQSLADERWKIYWPEARTLLQEARAQSFREASGTMIARAKR